MHVAQMNKAKALGQDLIIVSGGLTTLQTEGFQAGRRVSLTYDDYLAVRRQCFHLKRSSPEFYRGPLVCKTPLNSGSFMVHGVYPEYQDIRSIVLEKGRLINDGDNEQGRRVCIIGDEVRDQLFKDADPIGQIIHIQSLPFTVVGLLIKKDQNSNYSGPDKRKVFIPFHTIGRDFPDPRSDANKNRINYLILQPQSAALGDAAESQIRQVLGKMHNFDPQDRDALPIWNTVTSTRMVGEIFESMRVFLGFVGLVTLALGGLGVTNIMLVSVRERTREIGLRKAVGATRRRILVQFFSEALALTLASGLIGLGLGWGFCELMNLLPKIDFFAGLILTPGVAIGVTLFLMLVGLLSGIYPALTAAELDPVEALRYE
jgi:putative ABC transport system permease protein